MHLDLSGRSVLVTGGTRGIGRAIVEAVVAAGARAAFTYRASTETAAALTRQIEAQGGQALAIQGEAADLAAAQAVVDGVLDAYGSLDVLVNNAGVTRDNLLIRMTEEDWDVVIDTNLKSLFAFCKAVYRPMMRQRSGSIINMSSVVGLTGNPGQANYAASKAGIVGFTKSLARELGGRNVRVNAIAPGFVETEMTAALPAAAREAMLSGVVLGRAATPADIANAAVFLASDASAYITGQVLHVNGGLAM